MKGKQWLWVLAPLLVTSCGLPGAIQSAQEQAARKAAEQASQQQGRAAQGVAGS